ncbi:MAG: four helix bundle protein [Anaerolineae bacterium]|nr:four helix bundle protein [Anaerolineae bacterium]MCB0206949.1 four helix bundle protein [Anaerolineae bacterium]
MQESPIFTRTHDMLLWLAQATRKFPREYRFTLAQRTLNQAFTFQDALIAASIDATRVADHLLRADIALTGLRKTLLICLDLQLLDNGQYRHVSGLTAETGRLLGGWQRTAKDKAARPNHRVSDGGTGPG